MSVKVDLCRCKKIILGKRQCLFDKDIDVGCKEFEEENIHICIDSQEDRDFLLKVSEK